MLRVVVFGVVVVVVVVVFLFFFLLFAINVPRYCVVSKSVCVWFFWAGLISVLVWCVLFSFSLFCFVLFCLIYFTFSGVDPNINVFVFLVWSGVALLCFIYSFITHRCTSIH